MWRSAIAHIVFGVNLEEADAVPAGKRVLLMLRLEADTDDRGILDVLIGIKQARAHPGLRCRNPAGSRDRLCGAGPLPRGRLRSACGQLALGSSEPVPFGVLIVVQVPLGTSAQAAGL